MQGDARGDQPSKISCLWLIAGANASQIWAGEAYGKHRGRRTSVLASVLSGDERRGDRAGVALDRRADAGIDAIANRLDRGGEPQKPARCGRRRRRA
jgi:hypothetical protein